MKRREKLDFLLENSEKEKSLNEQLDEIYGNYLTERNPKIQKLKSEILKESHLFDEIDPNQRTFSERQRLAQRWFDLQRKFDEQKFQYFYKPSAFSSSNWSLGELHLKNSNPENGRISNPLFQRQHFNLIDPFENQVKTFRNIFFSSIEFLQSIARSIHRILIGKLRLSPFSCSFEIFS